MKKIVFILLLIYACNPAKRLSRIIEKNPYLIQKVDTTIYFETSSVDTQFLINNLSSRDTFYIQDTKTKIFRYYDTLRVIQESQKDSFIITNNEIILQTENKNQKAEKNIFQYIVIILSFIVAIMVLYLFRNIIK